jgi:hypothetical protein
MPNLAAGPSSFAKTVRSRSRAQHPFGQRAPALLVREEPPRPPTLRPLGSPRGSPRLRREDASHRPLQPTLDTSTRPFARLPSPQLAPRRPPPRCAQSVSPDAIRNAASDHLAAIQAPGGAAFDDAPPASAISPTSLFFNEEETSPARRQSYPFAAFSAATGPAIRPLTPPVAPRVCLFPGIFGAPGPLSPPSRQRGRLPRSEAPFVDKCSLSRLRGGSPPPFPQLCRRGPASGALSPLALLSHGGARPSAVVTGYSPVVARTMRRLSTSAIETCQRAQPLDRPSPAHRAGVASCAAFVAGGKHPFRGQASRDFTGQGPAWLTHT